MLNYKADDISHANNKLKIISEIQTKKIKKCDTYKRECKLLKTSVEEKSGNSSLPRMFLSSGSK